MTLKLCYVEDSMAWFTTNENQWGDDWNDAPYEHNAGTPYRKDGHVLYRLMYRSHLMTPGELANYNSWVSVEDINNGKTPWLKSDMPEFDDPVVEIFAGVSPDEFVSLIELAGGEVFFPKVNLR